MKHTSIFQRSGRAIVTFKLLLIVIIFQNMGNAISQTLKDYNFKQAALLQGFIENKGQIIDQYNKPNPCVKYLLNMPGLNVQLRANGFSYDAYVVESHKKEISQDEVPFTPGMQEDITLNFNRIDIEFIGANTSPEIIAELPGNDYMNYYTTCTPEEGVTYVKHYGKVTYKDLYPGIDMVFKAISGDNRPVEYSFIIHPGADLSLLKWKYTGSSGIRLQEGTISIQTEHGMLKESIPLSFEKETGKPINISYKEIQEGIYAFEGKNNRGKTLIIDPLPNIQWATYYGGSGNDQAYGVSYDSSGNVYVVGETTTTSNIATSGTQQTTYGGGTVHYNLGGDAFVVKFSPSGARLWGTYYGGTAEDLGYSIKTNKSGDSYITGDTQSPAGIATTGAFQTTFGGGSYHDPFLAKFNTSGIRQWGTYFGGSGNDRATTNGIAMDANGNVYITGTNNTASSSSITTPGCYQSTNGSTSAYDEPFAAKFSPTGTLIWGTYFGGGGSFHDQGYGIALDSKNNVYLTGATTTTSTFATIGAYQISLAGGTDAFIVKLNSTGTAVLWGTYYGGSGNDLGRGIVVDSSGNVYVAGYTVSTSGIASAGAYQTTFAGGSYDGFLVKFTSTGTRVWGTYFGGSDADVITTLALSSAGDLLMAGYTPTTSGLATSGAFQTAYGGGTQDGLMAKFTPAGTLKWCSYFGGDLQDLINHVATDAGGNIYIAGRTLSTTGIATAGAFQTTNGGGTMDGFVAKFRELYGQNNAGINRLTAPPGYICAGPQDVKVEVTNAGLNTINTVYVKWTINGVAQPKDSITTPLLPGGSRILTLGNINFPINTLTTIKAWTYLPNGVPDTVKGNDTIVVQRKPGLNGTYTIGGTTPDYATFSAAASDLNNYGICGPVVFRVRAGTYNERITLNQVTGASGTNTISFIGADKNTTILTSSGTSTLDMATILLNGTDHITFRDMTIKNTGASFGAGIWITGTADTNRFINLNVTVDTTSTSANVNGIVSSGAATAAATDGNTGGYTLFDSIVIKGGYHGLRINGPNTTTSYVLRNTISHCTFIYQYQYSLYLHNQSFPFVYSNSMTTLRNPANYDLYIDYCANIEVARNSIYGNDCGMYLNYVNRYLVNSGFTSRIYNNMISSTAGYASYANQCSLLKFLHNSFNSNPAQSVVRFAGCLTMDVINNHIQNRSTTTAHYVLYSDVSTAFSSWNYNNYFTSSSFVYIGSTDYGNLPVLQAALTTFNQNSYSQDPLYYSATDLHTSVNLTGIYVGIDDDIDGDFRNTTAPVLGADEVNIPNNAGISHLVSPVPAFCAGSQDVKVEIGNYGINVIDSVWVYWKLNGVLQTPVNIKTSIPLRGFYDVTLGTVTFAVGETKNLKIWTSLPNGVVDPLPKNDTLVIAVKTGLSGTYTIGGTSPDYANFNQAVTALGTLGVCSPVVFNVRAGTYTERVTIPPIKGASPINTITFKGAGTSSTGLSYSGTSTADWSTLYLKGADYIIFRDMTISAMGTTYGIGILLTGTADSNRFVNLMVQTSITSAATTLAGVALMTSATDMYAVPSGQPGDGNVFDSLNVSGGYFGIYLNGYSNYTTVSNSTLTDQALGGIDCSYQKYLKVYHNTTTTLRTTAFSSLNVTSTTNFQVYANNFNIAGSNGMYLQLDNSMGIDTNFRSYVYNNMVSNTVGYSLYCENTTSVKFWYNSFRSVGNSSSIFAAVYLKTSGGIDLRNNNIRNDNPSSYGLYADMGTFDSLDYNNYYSFGNFVLIGTPYPNLTALRLGFPQFNVNSYNQDPQYISITNLHTTSFLKGSYLGINQDIDGDSRCPNAVSVGADDKNWGFIKPVITTNHTNFFTNYPVRFMNNLTALPGITFKWYVNGTYITDSVSFQYTFLSQGSYKVTLQAERCIYRDSAMYLLQIVPGNHLITLKGPNPDSSKVFTTYTEPGYTAKDFFGNIITNLVITGNNYNSLKLGTYYVWYTVEDTWGNKDSVTRTVVIIDDIAPIISLIGKDTLTIEVFGSINDPGAKVIDNYDTNLTISVDSSMVNKNVVGIYKIKYSSTDHSGNTGTASRWVKVVDTIAPVITLVGSDTVLVDVFSQYTEAGAKVSDNYCKSGLQWNVDIYPPTNKLATFILTYTASDCQGNFAKPVRRVVKVVDRERPVITLNGFPYVTVGRWQTYTDAGVTIADNYYPEDTLKKLLDTTSNVDLIVAGTYNVCYQVTDPSGNKSLKVCRTVRVLESTSSIKNYFINKIHLYPNPSQGRFVLDIGEVFTGQAVVIVSDLFGKELYRTNVTGQQTILNLDGFDSGNYLLKIFYGEETATMRLNIIR